MDTIVQLDSGDDFDFGELVYAMFIGGIAGGTVGGLATGETDIVIGLTAGGLTIASVASCETITNGLVDSFNNLFGDGNAGGGSGTNDNYGSGGGDYNDNDVGILIENADALLNTPNYPIDITSDFRITTCFNETFTNPFTGEEKLHKGIDYGIPEGTKIFATWDGTVANVNSPDIGGYGKFVLIKHQCNINSVYGHLSSICVNPGDHVKRGQLVGYSGGATGITGLSTGPHLHFEIRQNGVRVDPERFLHFSLF